MHYFSKANLFGSTIQETKNCEITSFYLIKIIRDNFLSNYYQQKHDNNSNFNHLLICLHGNFQGSHNIVHIYQLLHV